MSIDPARKISTDSSAYSSSTDALLAAGPSPLVILPPMSLGLDTLNLAPITFSASTSSVPSRIQHWDSINPRKVALAEAELIEYAETIANQHPRFLIECHRITNNEPETYHTLETAFVAYVFAQKKQNYNLADYIYTRFGERLVPVISEHYLFLKESHLGVDEDTFLTLIRSEIAYVKRVLTESRGTKSPHIFDKNFLKKVSKAFLSFWTGQQAPHVDFETRLQQFPFKGRINYLAFQKAIWNQFQKDERMKDFPIEEIWRFGIDLCLESDGPCSFEQEPGYLKGYLRGILYALRTADAPKSADWYAQLHHEMTQDSLTPKRNDDKSDQRHYVSWSGDFFSFSAHKPHFRKSSVEWPTLHLDRDDLGMKDITSNRHWTYAKGKISNYLYENATVKAMGEKLDSLMRHYQHETVAALSRAHKLVHYLSWARELELQHCFSDANGRSSHGALIGMIAGEKGLPMFLFPDPNVFDCNGPESLCYRYLEGCVNFRNGGRHSNFEVTCEVKSLDALDLSAHEDLLALREELKPLVVGKEWAEVVHLFEIREKRAPEQQRPQSSSKKSRNN